MLKRILKTSPSATYLIFGIILGLAVGYGLIVLGMIIAWLIFGEGEASQLYHDSTVIAVLTSTVLILLGLSALIGKFAYRKDTG
jgi:H+/Cl- antiporter ClcA